MNKSLTSFLFAVFVQISSAQIFNHIPRNAGSPTVNNQQTHQIPNANFNTIHPIQKNGIPGPGNPNLLNNLAYTPNHLANAPIPHALNENAIRNPNIGGFIYDETNAKANKVHEYVTNHLVNAAIPHALEDKAVITNPNIGAYVANEAYANIRQFHPNIAASLAKMADINGNMATFNLGNGGFTVTSGSPGIQGFGVNVLADALEVGGRVAVNGQIPIFGAVNLNGHLPTNGSASVRYNCGGQKEV